MRYKVVSGSRTLLSHTTSWVRAMRCLLDHADVVAEQGTAYIVNSDGKVVAGIDIDLGVSMRRR